METYKYDVYFSFLLQHSKEKKGIVGIIERSTVCRACFFAKFF